MKKIGTLTWYNPVKGYGFITPTDNSKDVFVHVSELKSGNVYPVEKDIKLEFEIKDYNGKPVAFNITKI